MKVILVDYKNKRGDTLVIEKINLFEIFAYLLLKPKKDQKKTEIIQEHDENENQIPINLNIANKIENIWMNVLLNLLKNSSLFIL
jgi:hypothetical protein